MTISESLSGELFLEEPTGYSNIEGQIFTGYGDGHIFEATITTAKKLPTDTGYTLDRIESNMERERRMEIARGTSIAVLGAGTFVYGVGELVSGLAHRDSGKTFKGLAALGALLSIGDLFLEPWSKIDIVNAKIESFKMARKRQDRKGNASFPLF